ncbi:MAG: type II secretion system GspH family protein, partial [Armatimonadota bacterium]|nr:type II secretion system GspH family protein [Armatimonadota bacterium]
MSQRTSTSRGFTLVELLVVVGICALLIAILLPVLVLTRAKARQTVCVSNLGQLNLAFVMYAADHDGVLPPYNNNVMYAHDRGEPRHFPSRGDLLVASLRPYTHSPQVWFCPEDIFAHKGSVPGVSVVGGLWIDHRLS